MFWILCTLISCLCLKFTLSRNGDGSLSIGDSTLTNFILIAVFVMISAIQFGIGIDVYPSLASELSEVQTLEKRIEDIRGANYAYEKDGRLIAGSVENLNQSTNLTKYIADLAAKEASYNKKLKKVKVYREVFPLYFFGTGWAISDRVEELPILGGALL